MHTENRGYKKYLTYLVALLIADMERLQHVQSTQEMIYNLYMCRDRTLDPQHHQRIDRLLAGLQLHQSRLGVRHMPTLPDPTAVSDFRVAAQKNQWAPSLAAEQGYAVGLQPNQAMALLKSDHTNLTQAQFQAHLEGLRQDPNLRYLSSDQLKATVRERFGHYDETYRDRLLQAYFTPQ